MTRAIVLGAGLARIGRLAFVILSTAVMADAQSLPPNGKEEQAVRSESPVETIDVFDLVRQLRHKEGDPPPESWDYRKPMIAFAPVIGAKPSAGVLLGAAGNVAFYRGDPSTTHISSTVTSLTFSTKKQIAITNRFTMFGRDNRWRLDGDHRFQWTSLETFGLGTSADTETGVTADFDFFRLHQTAFYQLRPALYVGAGLYFDNHTNVDPLDGEEAGWAGSSYPTYSEAHGLPLDSQIAAGTSLDALWDSRDNFINADHGWLAKASYRTLFDGFLGGDSSWQKLNLDVRTYVPVSRDGRHKLAFWGFADLVLNGVAPYFDLPSTAGDTYGRSARGYAEGQFRGERLAYGEVEYRGTLMRNGLLGMVAFVNTTTVTNLENDERIFDSFAPAGGAGVRLLINKRSKTNLCFDVGFGKQGSRGVYLAIQEAF
jgi:outer membrane protein assembly factor BamA